MTRSVLSALFLLAAPALLLGGCKPKAGASCKSETKEVCVDGKQALACHDGKWEEMKCRGPAGCVKATGDNACDQGVAEPDDVCNLAHDFVCTGDNKAMLECTKNRWTVAQACLGERACAVEQKKVTCDNSIANLDDVCREEDDYACAPDKKVALVCRGGKFILASQCKGKNACRVVGDKAAGFKVECDDSIASAGDACDKEGHYACAADDKQIIKCVGKKFVADDKCKRHEKCAIKGELVGCY